jgi:hypothetical protein
MEAPAQLYALAGGRAWASFPGGERRARRTLARLGAQLVPAAADPAWSPAVTHVIAATPARSLLWVCAAASANAFILTPEFVGACDASNSLLPPDEFEWRDTNTMVRSDTPPIVPCTPQPQRASRSQSPFVTASQSQFETHSSSPPPSSQPQYQSNSTQRLWLGSSSFWRAHGPPLRGHSVLIVGELRPPGAHGVASSDMLELMLTASGASVHRVYPRRPALLTFALVPPNIGACPPNARHSDLVACLCDGVLCLGAAFVADLVAKASASPAEYVAFDEQRTLVAPRITPVSFAKRKPDDTWRIPIALSQVTSVSDSAADIVSMAIGVQSSSEKVPRTKKRTRRHMWIDADIAGAFVRDQELSRSAEPSRITSEPLRQVPTVSLSPAFRRTTRSRAAMPTQKPSSYCHSGEPPQEHINVHLATQESDSEGEVSKPAGSLLPDISSPAKFSPAKRPRHGVVTTHSQLNASNFAAAAAPFPPTVACAGASQGAALAVISDALTDDDAVEAEAPGVPRRKRRAPIVAESPPSDDEDGDAFCHDAQGSTHSRSSCDDEDLLIPLLVTTGSRPALNGDRVEDSSQGVVVTENRKADSSLSCDLAAANFSAGARGVPRNRRVRMRTPRHWKDSGDAGVIIDLSALPMCDLEDRWGKSSSAMDLTATNKDGNKTRSGSAFSTSADDIFGLKDIGRYGAMSFIESKVKLPSEDEINRLRVKHRVAYAGSARRADQQASKVNVDGSSDHNRYAEDVEVESDLVALSELPATRQRLRQQLFDRQRPEDVGGRLGCVSLREQSGPKRQYESPSSILYLQRVLKSTYVLPNVVGQRLSGNSMDDDNCEALLSELYWLFCADRISGLHGLPSRLEDQSHRLAVTRQASRLLLESSVLSKSMSVVGPRDMRVKDSVVRSISGFCSRLLAIQPSEDVVAALLAELLRIRDIQMQIEGIDAIAALLSRPEEPPANRRHHAMACLWVEVINFCDGTPNVAPFWSLFNKAIAARRSKFVGSAAGVARPAGKLDLSGSSPLTMWDEWCLESAVAFGSLYAVTLVDDADQAADHRREDSDRTDSGLHLAATAMQRRSNWPMIDDMLQDLQRSVTLSDAGEAAAVVPRPDGRLSALLRHVVFELASKLWAPSEELVSSVISLVHSFYMKLDVLCLCSSAPKFLIHLRHTSDAISRRSLLLTLVKTPCDCAVFLSWLLMAQSPPRLGSRIASKVVRLGSNFARSALATRDPPRIMYHSISLTMSIADSIAPPDQSRGEDNLLGMMFSKAPHLSKAIQNPRAFGSNEKECWLAVLETTLLRCRVLTSSGRSIAVYIDYIAMAFSDAAQCLERPDERFGSDTASREAGRVQSRMLLELAVKMLDVVSELLSGLDLKLAAAEPGNQDRKDLDASDDALGSLAHVMNVAGKLLQGIVSQLRSSSDVVACAPRHAILVAILRLLSQGMILATKLWRMMSRPIIIAYSSSSCPRRLPPSRIFCGMIRLMNSVQDFAVDILVDVVRRGVVLTDSAIDAEVREIAGKTLARVLGLSSLSHSSGKNQKEAASVASRIPIVSIVQAAGMDVSATDASLGMSTYVSRTSADTTPPLLLASRGGRVMAADFWATLLDGLWADAVLDSDQYLEKMVIATWIILLSSPEAVACPRPVLRLAWSLKSACDSRSVIASFFQHTLLHSRMVESDPSMLSILVDLRPSTVSDALAVATKSGFFLPDKLLALLSMLASVSCEGGMEASSPSFKELVVGNESGRLLSSFECMCFQVSLSADLAALIFAVRMAMNVLSSEAIESGSGGGAGNGKRFTGGRGRPSLHNQHLTSQQRVIAVAQRSLDTMSAAVLRLQDVSGVDRISDNLRQMHSRVSALVLFGMACLGYDSGPRMTDMRVRFSRFTSMLGVDDILCPLDHLPLPPWVVNLGLANDAAFNQERRKRLSAGCQWRSSVLTSLVEDPLTCSSFGSNLYYNGASRLLALLSIHERVGTDASVVAKDVRPSLSRILSTLPREIIPVSLAISGSPTLVTCQKIGLKVRAMWPRDISNAHAQQLIAVATGIIAQTTVLLEY